MSARSILFISNGYGEDTIATSIIKCLKEKGCTCPIRALPLVGQGKAYEILGFEVLGPRRLMPSGGLIPGNPGNLIRDMKNGLFRLTAEQIGAIRRIRKEVALTVAVGDIYPVILSALFSSKPLVMVGTAKSDYFYHYNWIERLLMSVSCEAVFTRDQATAISLLKRHIKAFFAGNAMMDCLVSSDEDFGITHSEVCIGILPGSRSEAYGDCVVILQAIERLWALLGEKASFIMSLADTLDRTILLERIMGQGWSMEGSGGDRLSKGKISVRLVKGKFGDILRCSRIIIGQAGTGNEQAVGLGRPVVTFDSGGREKLGWYRLRQKGLLGDAIAVVKRDGESIAREVYAILGDPGRYEAMVKAGQERMGSSGAAEKMADCMLSILEGIPPGKTTEGHG